MSEIRNRSIRVDDEVWAAIQGLPGRTQNEALRAALFGNGSDTEAKISEILELSRSMAGTIEGAILQADAALTREIIRSPAHADPRTVPGVSVGMPPPEVEARDGFPCRCIHANCGKKFIGATRTANICENCRENGHKGNPSTCPECLLLQGGL